MSSDSQQSVAGAKRKRSPEPPHSRVGGENVAGGSNVTQINYLVRTRNEKLRLVEGDVETFGDVLNMLDDYEGVLQSHESLAANLGAKLVGPLLLKSIEKLFDGPIRIFQASDAEQGPITVTWLDIVALARSEPSSFVLSTSMHGAKVCRFFIKGLGVEISEDDYRLLMSGAPSRMLPSNPIPEDESAELGTLNILEGRLAMLIKKADAVASKARQLNYHLKQRKTAIVARKGPEPEPSQTNLSPQPFSPINIIRSVLPVNGEASRLQQDLLAQFSADSRHPTTARPSKSKHQSGEGGSEESRRVSHGPNTYDDAVDGRYRLEMAARIEKLRRGDPIYPPCDRCRRLKFDCAKHLTACTACTKKHAKCSWKDVQEHELTNNPAEQMGGRQASAEGEGENGFVVEATEGSEQHTDRSKSVEGLQGGEMREQMVVQEKGTELVGKENGDRPRDSVEHALLAQMASAAVAAGSGGQ